MSLLALPALADNYIWLCADAAGNALVVDPGAAAPVQTALAQRGWCLRAIVLTHRGRTGVRPQNITRQNMRRPEDAVRNIDQPVGQGVEL